MDKPERTSFAATLLLAAAICLAVLAALSWHTAARSLHAAQLAGRHQAMSAALDGITVGLLQVEMAHEHYLGSGEPGERARRDKALAALGAALQAVDPAMLEETGHAARFKLLAEHARRRLPAWLAARGPVQDHASVLRTGARFSDGMQTEERRMAASEAQSFNALVAQERIWEHYARTGLALHFFVLGLALCLVLVLAAISRRAGGAPAWLAQVWSRAAGTRRRFLACHETITAKERQRISRDMHDGLGQDLFALKLELAHCYARTSPADPQLHASAGQALRLVDELIDNLRAIIEDLRPDALELGLDAAIRGQVDQYLRRSGSACSFDLKLEPVALEQAAATAMFRILQEALNNIHKHAGATRVCVALSQRDGAVALGVTDNGCGFHPARQARPGSFGLAGMRERVGALGGQLTIDSAPGRGTSLRVAIALRKTA
jgi:signal transduction histidine kinase